MAENDSINIRTDNYFAAFPHWVLDKKLSSSAIHLYLALLSYANWETKMGKPSRQTLANLMNCSIKTVDRAKDELVENGLLTYSRRPNNSNYYTVVTANPHSDKNDISKSGSDKNDTSGSDKNDTLTRINTNKIKEEPNGSVVRDLMKLYFENYTGELEMDRGQAAGQIQAALKQTSFDKLAPAIKQVAIEGKVLSRNTLIQAMSKFTTSSTPQPNTFDREAYEAAKAKAVPMPPNFKELFMKSLESSRMPE